MSGLLVYARMPSGCLQALELPPGGRVGDLKAAIEEAGGPAAALQRVRLGAGVLEEDAETLADSGIASQVVLGVEEWFGLPTVACGDFHSAAVMHGGLTMWGSNVSGQLELPDFGGAEVVSVAASNCHTAVVLDDGRVALWGCDVETW
eukprot:Hpha_TRINITY_DN22391_c0_g1::TRINITY_DN22391_c0_g1_i1::g.177651::m.177651